MLDQTISHYRITQKLGAGGMGVVYKAVDLQLERTVALKFLPDEVALSQTDKENLLREARAASALDHPNIGVIHGLEESENHQHFIVMAYYEGETLSQKLNRGVVSVRDSLDYAIQAARGLSAAHARNIVHRDVKPSNIIITKDNVAKIVDFGLARMVATASATQSISNTGTLPYMAPEQILGEGLDQRVDIWALGVVLVQMLTGSHPFLRPNTAAMTFAILNQPPAAVDAVPAPVQPIVYRALSKQASHRYGSMEEMRQDLETARAEITSTPLAQDEPTVTRAISARELKEYVENASTPRWGSHLGVSAWSLRRILLAGLAVALVAVGVLFVPAVREQVAGLVYAYSGGEKHIAVLPFANPGNDADFEPVADGLMDSVTNDLSNLEAAQQSLWVLPASVVRSSQVKDPAAAFRTLGATVVVQSSIRRKGQGLLLTVNLIDSKHLRQLGSVQLEDRSGNLAALEGQALSHIARLIRIRAPMDGLQQAQKVTPSSYESYVKSLSYLQRFDKPGNLDQAVAELTSAVKTDPSFALGYATLGQAYRLKYQMDHHPAWLEDAATNCEKAIAIDDRLPAAHVTLGSLNSTLGKNDLALQEFQKALNINPRDADAVLGMATINENLSHWTDAEANYKRAIALRPEYWGGYTALGSFYDRQNRVQDAIAQFKHVTELTPDNPVAYSNLGAEYMVLDDAQSKAAAEAAFEKSIQLAPNYAAYANLGLLYSYEKRYADAAGAMRKALDLNDKDWRVWSNLTNAYLWLGDDKNVQVTRPKALKVLEEYAVANSQDALVQADLSTFYAEDKKREKALARAESALALAPKDPAVLAGVADTYEILGDRKRALSYAQESLKNGASLADLQLHYSLQNLVTDPSFSPRRKQ
jgi:serine/threonine protein kinase/tetratricopeptide (TPR) repeat protein